MGRRSTNRLKECANRQTSRFKDVSKDASGVGPIGFTQENESYAFGNNRFVCPGGGLQRPGIVTDVSVGDGPSGPGWNGAAVSRLVHKREFRRVRATDHAGNHRYSDRDGDPSR